MLRMIQKRLTLELSNANAALIQQNIQTRFNSLFHRIRLEYLHRIGLDASAYALTAPPADSDLMIGELLLPEPGTICYIKGLRNSGYLEVGAVSNTDNANLEELFINLHDAIGEVIPNLPAWETPESFTPLVIENSIAGDVNVDANELAAARAMMDSASREVLAKIKDAGSIFLNKIYTEDRQGTEARIRNFEELKLISKEYAVLCRRTGQQILRVADRSTIDESSQRSFKCFICGSPLADELVEEIVTSNDLCANMFKDNKWLLVLLQGILGNLGIGSEAISVYRVSQLPTHVFLTLNGQRYLFVLCTENLTLDQANMIGAHISAYSLNQVVLISTTNVSILMRNHLSKMNGNTKFHFICDLNNLDDDIKNILITEQSEYVSKQLDDISKATPINIPILVLSRMLPKIEEPKAQKSDVIVETAVIVENSAEESKVAEQIIEDTIESENSGSVADNYEDIGENSSEIPTYIPNPGDSRKSKKGNKRR